MNTLKTGVSAALLALAAAACSESAGPEPLDGRALDADVAMIAAQVTIDDVGEMSLTAADGALGAPGHGRRDLSRTRTVTFFDGKGNEMEAFDPLLTASVETVLDVTAEREGERWAATVARHRELVLSGLEGEETERTWNGSGTDDVSRTRFDDGTGERSFTMSGTVAISDVVVGVPRRDHPWPLSGTITRHVEVAVVGGPRGDRTAERTVTITFDGTRFATLEVNGETFVVDLADRDGRRPGRRGGG